MFFPRQGMVLTVEVLKRFFFAIHKQKLSLDPSLTPASLLNETGKRVTVIPGVVESLCVHLFPTNDRAPFGTRSATSFVANGTLPLEWGVNLKFKRLIAHASISIRAADRCESSAGNAASAAKNTA